MNLKITSVAHHRNGISGEPFYVFLFDDKGEHNDNMMAVVFPLENGEFYAVDQKNRQEWNGRVSVFNVNELAKGNIGFANGNSWRGDRYEADLRKYIHENES
jgi:hypothetical protein